MLLSPFVVAIWRPFAFDVGTLSIFVGGVPELDVRPGFSFRSNRRGMPAGIGTDFYTFRSGHFIYTIDIRHSRR